MYCHNCGHEQQSNFNYCSQCGQQTAGRNSRLESNKKSYRRSILPSRFFYLPFLILLALSSLIYTLNSTLERHKEFSTSPRDSSSDTAIFEPTPQNDNQVFYMQVETLFPRIISESTFIFTGDSYSASISLSSRKEQISLLSKNEYLNAHKFCTIIPTKQNILYCGINNPVEILSQTYSPTVIQPSISHGMITDNNGSYTIKVNTPGTVQVSLNVINEEANHHIQTFEFRAKYLPDPTPIFGNRKSGVIPSAEVKNIAGLAAIAEGLDFDVRFSIIGFEITYKKARSTNLVMQVNNGSVFNSEVKKIFNQVSPGDKIWIDNIRVKAPDNTTRNLSMSLTVI